MLVFSLLLLLASSALVSSSPRPSSADDKPTSPEEFLSHAVRTINHIFEEENPQIIFSDVVKNTFNEHTNILHRLQQLHEANHPSRWGKVPNGHKNDDNDDKDSETSTTTRRYENSEATTTAKEGNETGVIRKEIDYLKQKYDGIRRDIDKWMASPSTRALVIPFIAGSASVLILLISFVLVKTICTRQENSHI
ncbi:hypothetical protein WR25_25289 isoform A [Diploscapter pachys]|uniref:SXP/RAL-2 family protein Ani s 5-like cation-binding domain-containing protein n=1 Tax=Diploscapter pachys TaxID=2018661 RepID=A0A2A2K9Q6_9BILA|nr:hypothetical protein WR25_25289 isoform A [Diploscapter pachys]